MTIKWEAQNSSNNRFFLDDVIIETLQQGAYTITRVCNPTEGGTITASKSTANQGDPISFTATAAAGYELDAVTVKDANDNDVTVTDNGGGSYSFTMPDGNVTISANFIEATALYIIGQACGNWWNPTQGVRMTYENGTYSAKIFVTGPYDNSLGGHGGTIAFSQVLANDNNDGGWGYVNSHRYEPASNVTLTTASATAQLSKANNNHSILLPAGLYEVTVSGDHTTFTLTAVKDITPSLTPAGGTQQDPVEVELNSSATLTTTEDYSAFIANCKPVVYAWGNTVEITPPTVKLYINDQEASTYEFSTTGVVTLTGKAVYEGEYDGNISIAKTTTGTYNVYRTYQVLIDENLANGNITANPNTARAGQTVTLTVTPGSGAQLSGGPTVTGVTDITDNGDGTYTFTMPASDVTVSATFTLIDYTITVNYPNGNHGTIANLPATANNNESIEFTITPSNKYEIAGVTATFMNNNGQTINVNGFTNNNGQCSFNMPPGNVTISITYQRISTSNVYELVTDASTLKAGDKIIFTNGASSYVYAMSSTQNSNNRPQTNLSSLVTNNKVEAPEGTQVITLEGQAGAWYFNVGNGYLTAASSTSNYLRTATTNTNDNTKATISISGNVATMAFQGEATRKYIRYNDGSDIFACYGSATDQKDVCIFRQTATGLQVDITPESCEVIGTVDVTIEANDDNATVSYKIGEDGQVVSSTTSTATATVTGAVGETVTVYAYATLDDEGETLTDESSATYTFIAPNAPTIAPATCHISDVKQSVTITSEYTATYPNALVEYSTDGGATWNTYTARFDVPVETFGQSATVQARVTVNGVTSEVTTATYTRDIQPVVFSPASGTYRGDQTCQMFSTTTGARIYYTTDGSDPVMNQGTTQLYTGEIPMPATGTYQFKAVAYIGTVPSTVTSANYTIQNKYSSGNYLYSVAELNAHATSEERWTMVNPVQVIYMSTYQQNGYQPEFCLVRDNTGYGMIYFGKQNTHHDYFEVFEQGDWISGGYSGPISQAYSQDHGQLDTHPELGDSNRGSVRINNWSSSLYRSNTDVLPEYIDIPSILASETPGNTDYWGHYVHLRKTTIELTDKDSDGKWSGKIFAENGSDMILYYDKFYLQYGNDWTATNNDFTGHPNRTFDVYGFVACHLLSETHYQIAPFAFAWIDMPTCSHVTGEYTSEQRVTLASDEDPDATIWYKTSDMDDYKFYQRGSEIVVNNTTTIEWYATKHAAGFSDELESKKGSVTLTFVEIAKPVISPESIVKTVGETTEATIAYEEGKTIPEDAVIVYTADGSDPKNSENVYTLGTTLTFSTTTTVRAITRTGNAQTGYVYSAEAEPRTYSFVKSNGVVYDLVTSVDQLTETGVYMIVSQNYGEALSIVQNEANRGAAGVMFVENTDKAKVYGNSDVALFQLTDLTHGEDQSGVKRFLFATGSSNDASANGYLCVGSETDNTLLVEPEEDALGNDVVAVTIDADGRAHLRMNYSGGSNRYVQYWNRDRYFTTYKSEVADRAVFIYYTASTPLAVIEKSGVKDQSYTVADDLQVVYVTTAGGKEVAWARDLVDNIDAVEIPTGPDMVDYLRHAGQQTGEWQQNNWVMLDLSENNKYYNNFSQVIGTNPVHLIIKGGSLSGQYVDDVNYTIKVSADANLVFETPEQNYTPNVYCAANYGVDQNGLQQGEYWFMTPKVMEVCEHTWAVWNGDGFYVPKSELVNGQWHNEAGLVGAFAANWTYNSSSQFQPTVGEVYRFLSVVTRKSSTQGAGAPRRVGVQPSDINGDYVVAPLNLEGGEQVITAVSQLQAGREVVSVTYCDVAGRMSQKPFEGLNIIVTRYSDGTAKTTKAIY